MHLLNAHNNQSGCALHFERTTDLDFVREVVTHPRLWEHVSDDGSGAREAYQPIEHASFWYVAVRDGDGDECLGLFLLHPQNWVTYEVHTCLLPCAWGARALAAARRIPGWFFEQNPHAERIVTSVPAYNRLALKLARGAGMTEYGLNPRSFRKRGELHDLHLLGISRTTASKTACALKGISKSCQ